VTDATKLLGHTCTGKVWQNCLVTLALTSVTAKCLVTLALTNVTDTIAMWALSALIWQVKSTSTNLLFYNLSLTCSSKLLQALLTLPNCSTPPMQLMHSTHCHLTSKHTYLSAPLLSLCKHKQASTHTHLSALVLHTYPLLSCLLCSCYLFSPNCTLPICILSAQLLHTHLHLSPWMNAILVTLHMLSYLLCLCYHSGTNYSLTGGGLWT